MTCHRSGPHVGLAFLLATVACAPVSVSSDVEDGPGSGGSGANTAVSAGSTPGTGTGGAGNSAAGGTPGAGASSTGASSEGSGAGTGGSDLPGGGGAGLPGGGSGLGGDGTGGAPIVPREPDAQRVDNPFVGVTGYVNPEWQAKADAEPGGERIASTPTAVWLDRIAAIEGTADSQSNGPMGLRDHLDAALAQGAGYAQFVIYNLPGRDCSALASNGELGPDELPRYKAEYIDPIVAIMGDPAYRSIRIINVIEVDSLPNLVTNLNVPACSVMKANGGYVDGIAYALSELGALPNTYNYVDAAHHGWLGWDTNFGPTAQLLADTAALAGIENVHGFITNTANYSTLVEPHFDVTDTVNGTTVRQASWVDWNFYVDELSFAQAFRDELVAKGFDSNIGMLIDTSRNGWGGPDRPDGPSTSTNVDTFVDESRVDRRVHAGNWCNQSGAGLGERPRASPEPGIDAYVWIKPPGESDGSSSYIPNDDGKGFDQMCDPTYGGNERNGNSLTGALPNAPISGSWFSAQFQELMANAYPPL